MKRTCSGNRYALKAGVISAALALSFGPVVPTHADGNKPEAQPLLSTLRLGGSLDDPLSRMMAVGLSSLVKIEEPGFSLNIVWLKSSDNVSEAISGKGVPLILLSGKESEALGTEGTSSLLGVMKFDMVGEDGRESTLPGVLLADEFVPAETIEALISVTMQDRVILKAARIDTARLTPADALQDLPMPRHPGVDRYLRLHGGPEIVTTVETSHQITLARETPVKSEGRARPGKIVESSVADVKEVEAPRRSFTLYFDTADADLDRSDFESVAEACKFAATLPRARFVISGHTDTVGSDPYNQGLSQRRAHSVANAIRNDPRFREVLNVVEFGESQLAITTDDGVAEPMNRRVEITVLGDEGTSLTQ
ncbi:MAG: OmpA family protein [Geminicoccaceae bacterium]